MTTAHDKILFQFLKAVSRIFDLCIPKTAGYGPNPKNIDDTLEIDIIGQKGNTLYVFEVKKDKNEIPAAITQLKDRHSGYS